MTHAISSLSLAKYGKEFMVEGSGTTKVRSERESTESHSRRMVPRTEKRVTRERPPRSGTENQRLS